jgi:hypothetical protein
MKDFLKFFTQFCSSFIGLQNERNAITNGYVFAEKNGLGRKMVENSQFLGKLFSKSIISRTAGPKNVLW